MGPSLVAAALGLSSLLWAARLALPGGPMSPGSAGLLAADLLLVTTVAVVGMLVARGRWARRLGYAALGIQAAAAVILTPDWLWWAALAASGIALLALSGPWLRGWVRMLPAATGPPVQAVLLALGLLVLPALVALTDPTGPGWDGLMLAGAAVLLGALYARAWVPALWAIRLALIPVAVPAFVFGPQWGAVTLAVSVVALAALAWTAGARLAVLPLLPQTSARVRIPPELAPKEILDAAGVDRQGRRLPRKQPGENGE